MSKLTGYFPAGRWLAALALLTLLAQCRQEKKKVDSPGAARLAVALPQGSTAHLSGRQLAQAYCQACHLFPEPALLDKQAWEKGVLPNMAMRLGLGDFLDNPYGGMDVEEIVAVQQAGAFADSPLVSAGDWEKIVAYYLAEAPDKPLAPPARPPLRPRLALFEEATLPDSLALSQMITVVKIDAPRRRLFVGDQQNHLYVLGPDFRSRQVLNLESPPTDVLPAADGSFRVVTIGVLPPSDRRVGGVWDFRPGSGETGYRPYPVLTKRKRPVQMAEADLDDDGLPDLVLAEHGHHTGKVSWYKNMGSGRYEERLLKAGPGARQVIVRDFNGDQKPDVLVLVGQGQEGVYLLLNQGRGRFSEQTLLRFPPVYGSSYLETGDFNGDGFTDLVYANGDNADFSFSLKAYHGL
ncbi:MAG: FG-GAP repeat domain-containing protein, partial [Adhaeribacter sp.]